MSGGFVFAEFGVVTGANVGGKIGEFFRDKIGAILNFKTLGGVTNEIDVVNNANDVEIGVGSNVPLIDASNVFSAELNQFFFVRKVKANQTISAGEITPTSEASGVDTEGGGATDDLDTVNMPSSAEAVTWMCKSISSARDVTLKDGAGNLFMAGDFTLTGQQDTMFFALLTGTALREISRSNNI